MKELMDALVPLVVAGGMLGRGRKTRKMSLKLELSPEGEAFLLEMARWRGCSIKGAVEEMVELASVIVATQRSLATGQPLHLTHFMAPAQGIQSLADSLSTVKRKESVKEKWKRPVHKAQESTVEEGLEAFLEADMGVGENIRQQKLLGEVLGVACEDESVGTFG